MNRQITEALSEARGLNCREASLLLDVALSCQWDETEREEDELPELGCDPWAVDTLNLYARISRRKREERAMPAPAELFEESWLDYAQEVEQPEDDNRAEEYADIRRKALMSCPQFASYLLEPREPRIKPESKPYLDITPLIAKAAKELYYKLGKGKGYFVKGRKDEVSDEYQITVLQAEKEIGTIRLKYIVPNQSFDQGEVSLFSAISYHEHYITSTLDHFYAWLTTGLELTRCIDNESYD